MATDYSPKIVTNGLVLCLDAANRKSYSGSGTVWTDLASSNNGTLTNGPTFSSANAGSIVFDGTNDYVSLAGVANNFSVGSVECWCKCDAPTNGLTQQIVARTNSLIGTFNIVKNSNNKFLVTVRLSTGTNYSFNSDLDATTNWTHIVQTYDGITQKMYVNGVQQSTTTSISGSIDTTGTLNINIGRQTTGIAHFDGQISIVRNYNRALTAAEILQNYNALKGRFGLT